jgi:hypothetical protein
VKLLFTHTTNYLYTRTTPKKKKKRRREEAFGKLASVNSLPVNTTSGKE